MSFHRLVRSDLDRYRTTFKLRGQKGSFFRIALESFLFKPGFQAVFLHRVAHRFHRWGLTWLAWAIARLGQFLTSAEIEFNAEIGPGLLIAHPAGIVIGRGTALGSNATIFQNVTFGAAGWHPDQIKTFPTVGDNVFFFAGAVIVGGVTLGSEIIVGANSVVIEDVPDGATVVGNPARMLPNRGKETLKSWGIETSQRSGS